MLEAAFEEFSNKKQIFIENGGEDLMQQSSEDITLRQKPIANNEFENTLFSPYNNIKISDFEKNLNEFTMSKSPNGASFDPERDQIIKLLKEKRESSS